MRPTKSRWAHTSSCHPTEGGFLILLAEDCYNAELDLGLGPEERIANLLYLGIILSCAKDRSSIAWSLDRKVRKGKHVRSVIEDPVDIDPSRTGTDMMRRQWDSRV